MKKFLVDNMKIARAMNLITAVNKAYGDNGVTDPAAVLELYGRALHTVFDDVMADVFETIMVNPITHSDPANLPDELDQCAKFYHQLGAHTPFCVFMKPFEDFVVERCGMNAATFIDTIKLDLTELNLDPASLEAEEAAEREKDEPDPSLVH